MYKKYVLLFTLLGLLNVGYSQSKIIGDLMDLFDKQEKVDCIISMKDQLDMYGITDGLTKSEKGKLVFNSLREHAGKSQSGLISYLSQEGIGFQSYFIFNGIAAKLTIEQLQIIISRDDVGLISHDQSLMLSNYQDEFVSPRMDAEWGIQKIKADSVWMLGLEGQGVTIAGQDTGYDFDNELILDKYRGYDEGAINHEYNWHDAIFEINLLHQDTIIDESLNPCGFLSPEPCDDHAHGTHTMGTMVGRDSSNLIGVAPQANWIGCRNMERGYGKPSTYTECFEWFLAPTDLADENPDPDKSPHVINNSWGCPEMEGCNPDNWHIMETAVNNLTAAGIFVVVSAGNDGSTTCGSIRNVAPIFENSFTIGATNSVDTIAGFSSIGPVSIDSSGRMKPDVVAPGVGVRSITLNGFGTWSGTSMAGPHVAGAVALIISANPDLAGEVDVIKDILKRTAVPLYGEMVCDSLSSDLSPNFVYGHGRIDVYKAVQEAMSFSSVQYPSEYKDQVFVFPNPTLGDLRMGIYFDNKIKNVKLFDLKGKQVYDNDFDDVLIDVDINDVPSGMYIYHVQLNDKITTGLISKH